MGCYGLLYEVTTYSCYYNNYNITIAYITTTYVIAYIAYNNYNNITTYSNFI